MKKYIRKALILFVNGRVRAIYVNIFVMCAAMLSLASCNSDDMHIIFKTE